MMKIVSNILGVIASWVLVRGSIALILLSWLMGHGAMYWHWFMSKLIYACFLKVVGLN